jgi:hypothetical protein
VQNSAHHEPDFFFDSDLSLSTHSAPQSGAADAEQQQASLPGLAPPDFDAFWAVYPRHEAKRTALSAWGKALKRAPAERIVAGALNYANDPNRPDVAYIPHPSTWLNGDRWDDPPCPPRPLDAQGSTSRTARRDEIDAAWTDIAQRFGGATP